MEHSGHAGNGHSGPGYASPIVAREQAPERYVYVAALYEGTGIEEPDFAAVLKSQVWLGGLLGNGEGNPKAGGGLTGPQMLQNSLDSERVYVSNSLYSTWDNQFYPDLRGRLTKLDRQAAGSYALDPGFFIDFAEQTGGARPHEIHLPGGNCTTEIFQ
jgi:selenium-binding protein 1